MAGANAAASISTTVGVASATVVVVLGILAGPTILDCSNAASGLGACLRDRLAQTGLIAPDSQGMHQTQPEQGASQAVADIPRQQGWIEANAGEYRPPLNASAELAAPVGAVELAGLFAATPAPVATVALAAPGGFMDATSGASTPDVTASALLSVRPGSLDGLGRSATGVTHEADVALASPGALNARGTEAPSSISTGALLSAPIGRVVGRGRGTTGSETFAEIALLAPGTLDAGADAYPALTPASQARLGASRGTLTQIGGDAGAGERFADVAVLETPGALIAGAADRLPVVSADALLTAPRGSITAIGGDAATGESFADVAVLEMPGAIVATGTTDAAGNAGSLVLRRRPGDLSAGSAPAAAPAPGAVVLSPSVTYLAPPATAGTVTAPRGEGAIVYLEATPWQSPDATGSIGSASMEPATVVLEASNTPLPVSLDPPPAVPLAAPAASRADLFPDVVMLPSPATGADSSFVTLGLP